MILSLYITRNELSQPKTIDAHGGILSVYINDINDAK
jgi:hypothetical protein